MKKFLTSVFMLSMVLFSMSVFDSCKDYDEDEYDDLLVKLQDPNAAINLWIVNNYTNLQNLYNQLKQAQEQCKQDCTNKFAALNTEIANLKAKDVELQTTINNLNAAIAAKASQAELDALKGRVQTLETEVANLKNVVIPALASDIANLKTTNLSLQNQIDVINTTLGTVQGDLAALAPRVGKNETDIQAILNRLKDAGGNDVITTLLTDVASLNTAVGNVETALAALTKNVYTKTQTDSIITKVRGEIEAKFTPLDNKVNDLSKIANEALERAKNDSVWVKELKTLVAGISEKVDINTSKIDSLASVTTALADALAVAEQNRQTADSLLQNQIDAIVLSLASTDAKVNDILNTKLPELEQAYKAADEVLQDNIDALAAKVQANKESIEVIEGKINTITGRLDNIDEALKSQITGIIVQATNNPVFGTFALPIGVNSNILMAFYGKNDNPIVFPTTATANNVKASEAFTAGDWAMIGSVAQYTKNGNSTLFSEADDNAGTVYLTVNPGSVDFAGQTLQLVNSKDETSKITLSPLVKENDVELTFGYTRAAETNGFYSAKAKLSESDIQAVKVNIQDGWKESAKAVLKERSMSSIANLAIKFYQQFNGVLPAQGLKASWTDYNGEHSIYSQYGIAATAVKPLSYAFLEDLNVVTVPGYELAVKFVNKAAAKIKEQIPTGVMGDLKSDLNGLVIKKIELKDLSSAQYAKFVVTADTTFTLSGEDVTLAFTYDLREAAKDLWNTSIDQFKDVNDMMDQLQKIVDDGNTLIAEANNKLGDYRGKVDTAADRIKSYIDLVNNKLAGLINSANERIQPVLFVGNRDMGVFSASRMKSAPTKLKAATVELIMTSYTAEIVTPAFKKHVAVTNVYKGAKSAQGGDATCKAALEAANQNINKVLEGSRNAVSVTFQKGDFIYEVAYSALDYSGKVSMHKYYVQY